MTGISDEFIAEAALVAPVGVVTPKKRPFASLSRALNSGWGVACICFIVAIAAVVGMVAWGRMGEITTPGSDPSVRFAFSYEMTDNNGSAWSGTAMPGDMVNVRTIIVNHGKPFKSYGFHAHARFVLQEDDSIIIEGVYPLIDAPKETIETNRVGTCFFSFQIPENATPGVYDLVLSYDGEKQVFGGALTVGEAAETYPPAEEGHAFSFGFKTPNMQSKLPKDFPIDVHVTNEGEPFTYEGDPADFSPDSAILYHMESGYEIKGYGTESGRPPKPCNVYFGQKGVKTYTFPIPADAPEGVYGIKLTYRRASESLPNVLIVNDGKVGTYVDRFTFGYEKPDDAYPGDTVSFFTQVANEWDAFTYEGSSSDFAPAATLIHRQTQYRLDGTFDTATDFGTHTVEHWALGNATQVFMIPSDAPVGDYDLVLSYGGYSQTFERVLTVAVPTVIDPAVLYNLTMSIGSDWLYEPIDEAYVDGQEVTVRIKFATDVGTLFILNGEVIDAVTGDDQLGYWEYNFIMPKKDSEIIFHTYDGTAPYGEMLKAFILSNPYLFAGEEQFYYYGEFGDGVMVALQLGYGEAIWSTAVGEYTFVTPNTHDMVAYCNGTLYELQTAYDMGLLTDGDLEVMMATHKEWFPDD